MGFVLNRTLVGLDNILNRGLLWGGKLDKYNLIQINLVIQQYIENKCSDTQT